MSQLIIGARPETFRMYRNSVTAKHGIINKTFIRMNAGVLPKELTDLYNDLFNLRILLEEFRYRYKYSGFTWNFYSIREKKNLKFVFPDDADNYLNKYLETKRLIECYVDD